MNTTPCPQPPGELFDNKPRVIVIEEDLRNLERELNEAKEDSKVLRNYHNNPEWLKHHVKGRDYSFPEFVDNIIAERNQLRADLKMCAEALKEAQFMLEISLGMLPFVPYQQSEKGSPKDLIDSCLNSPLIQRLLTKKEGE